MNDIEKMLAKQFLLSVRQEGYAIVENFPQSGILGINIDIYRGKTKICTFDDRSLGDWCLLVSADDSTREDIKQDFHKLFYRHDGGFLRIGYEYFRDAAELPLIREKPAGGGAGGRMRQL